MKETPRYIGDVIYHTNRYDKFYITGSLNGLTVTVCRNEVSVGNGSLCKWYLGDNCKTMGRGDTQRAVEKLSDILHLPMEKARITRMDVAQNLIMKKPVPVYLNHLGELARMERFQKPNALYYMQRNYHVCFYDKNKEVKAKGGIIPELYRGCNVLRYEQRYTGRLGARFKREAVTGAMLYDENFYMESENRWGDTYKRISKINDGKSNNGIMKTKTEMYNWALRLAGESVGGENALLNRIKEWRMCGELTPKQALDLKKGVTKAFKTGSVNERSDAITELDEKIRSAMMYYR